MAGCRRCQANLNTTRTDRNLADYIFRIVAQKRDNGQVLTTFFMNQPALFIFIWALTLYNIIFNVNNQRGDENDPSVVAIWGVFPIVYACRPTHVSISLTAVRDVVFIDHNRLLLLLARLEATSSGFCWKSCARKCFVFGLPCADSDDASAVANCSINFHEDSFRPASTGASGLDHSCKLAADNWAKLRLCNSVTWSKELQPLCWQVGEPDISSWRGCDE